MGFVLDREGKKSFILLTFYQMQYALSYAQPFFHFLFLSKQDSKEFALLVF
jgi:hypothetical protein